MPAINTAGKTLDSFSEVLRKSSNDRPIEARWVNTEMGLVTLHIIQLIGSREPALCLSRLVFIVLSPELCTPREQKVFKI